MKAGVFGVPCSGDFVMWAGEWGVYRVPEAIVSLARKADVLAGFVPLDRPMAGTVPFWERPSFRVVQEWGNWRDGQEVVHLACEAA